MNEKKVKRAQPKTLDKREIHIKKKYFFLKNLLNIKNIQKNQFQNFYAKKLITQFFKLKITIIKLMLN